MAKIPDLDEFIKLLGMSHIRMLPIDPAASTMLWKPKSASVQGIRTQEPRLTEIQNTPIGGGMMVRVHRWKNPQTNNIRYLIMINNGERDYRTESIRSDGKNETYKLNASIKRGVELPAYKEIVERLRCSIVIEKVLLD